MATAALPQPDHVKFPVGVSAGGWLVRRDNCVCTQCLARRYRRKILEGYCWIEGVKLSHLLDDPWADAEVVTIIERHYPGGWKRFEKEWTRHGD